MEISIDQRICNIWNNTQNVADSIEVEQTWEVCRIMVEEGIAIPNTQDVSLLRIGPFKVASTASPNIKGMWEFFLNDALPCIVDDYCTGMTFEQALITTLKIGVKVFCKLIKVSCRITDLTEWKLLVYIKKQNQQEIFPSFGSITEFFTIENENLNENTVLKMISGLEDRKSWTGENIALIRQEDNGGYFALV